MTVIKEQTILKDVVEVFETTLRYPSGKLDIETNFEDIGVDSIIAMELLNNLSKKFNVSISPANFTNAGNLKELADMLDQMLGTDADQSNQNQTQSPDPVPAVTKKKPAAPTSQSKVYAEKKEVNPFGKLISYIKEKYQIDLSYRTFNSVDEIVHILVTVHGVELQSQFSSTVKQRDLRRQERTFVRSEHPEDIAIVGLSCNFPDAPSPSVYWDNLLKGKVSFKEVPQSRWDWKEYYSDESMAGKSVSKWAALIEDVDRFDAQFFDISQEEAALMDPQERLLLQEVYKAFQDGGMNPQKLRGSKTGVFVSYEYQEYEQYLRKNRDRLKLAGSELPFFSSSSPSYYLANRLSFVFDFRGPSESVNINCAGSAVALHRAYNSLLSHESDVAVVGGASLNLFADDYIALSKLGMLSPDGSCGVFDDAANGFTRGEGVASVILKRLDQAEKDNNKIYGLIKASHQNNRGSAKFLSEIKVDSFSDVIADCYQRAAIDPQTVRYIELDGYATKWGDSFEFEGVKKVFESGKSYIKSCGLGSVKGNIGNLESVSGMASVIKLALSLYHEKFPASVSKKQTNNFIDLDNKTHPLYFSDAPVSFEQIKNQNNLPVRAGVNSFSDSGVNVHILLEQYRQNQRQDKQNFPTGPMLFILSAKNKDRLLEYVQDYINYMSNASEDTFVQMIYTLQTGREFLEERLAITAFSYTELLEKLSLAKKGLEQGDIKLSEKGIFHGNIKEEQHTSLVDLFSEQMIEMLLKESLQKAQWQKVAQLWISGFELPWEMIWDGIRIQPVSLPLYPFYKQRHWVEVELNDTVIKNESVEKLSEDSDEQTLKEPHWYFYMNASESENSQLSPVEKIGLFLKQEMAIELQKSIAEIDDQINLLYSGMSSIQIGSLVSKAIDLLGVSISPTTLFNHPKLGDLAQYLGDTYGEKIQKLAVSRTPNSRTHEKTSAGQSESEDHEPMDSLVKLQGEGEKTAFFAIAAGGNGASLGFNHLVRALGDQQPFYGIEMLVPSSDVGSVEKLALQNIEVMQKIQPKGPYRLLGYSNGGMIAFEMARILLEKGEKIDLLALLDSFSPLRPVIDVVDEISGVFNAKFSDLNGLDADELREVPQKERFNYLYDKLEDSGVGIPKKQLAMTYRIALEMDALCRQYKPSKIKKPLKVYLFRAKKGYLDGYEDLPTDYNWDHLLARKATVCHIDADHFSITDEKPSQQIAKKILSILERPKRKKKTEL